MKRFTLLEDPHKGTKFFVELYDVTETDEVLLKEWKLGEVG